MGEKKRGKRERVERLCVFGRDEKRENERRKIICFGYRNKKGERGERERMFGREKGDIKGERVKKGDNVRERTIKKEKQRDGEKEGRREGEKERRREGEKERR
jgi:hypothetical protein